MSELDKLNLSLSSLGVINELPKNIMFPDELNRYLREQIQCLSHENGMLKKNLIDVEQVQKVNERTIEQLNKRLQKYETPLESSSFISVGSIASSKLVELSKKLREKNSELGAAKTKISKLEQVIFEWKQEQSGGDERPISEIRPKCELEHELKIARDNLAATNKKFFELKNANTQFNNDMKLANKLLQQEIGDSFDNMQNLLTLNPNWRGRAQIIWDLQQKNNELREKLKVAQDKSGTSITKSDKEVRVKNEKRWDHITQENSQLKTDVHDLKRKLDAAKARCRVFDSECATLKAKFSAANEQNDRDTNLVTTLSNQLTHFQKTQADSTKVMETKYQKFQKENNTLQTELDKEKCKTQNFERNIDELQAKVTKCSCNVPSKKMNADTYDKNASKTIQVLETERLRLLELTTIANKRLEEEREAHTGTQAHFISERQRVARLDAKVARLQLQMPGGIGADCDYQYNRGAVHRGTSTVSINTGRTSGKGVTSNDTSNILEMQNVRDKLELAEEKVKALTTRLQIEQQEHKCDLQEFGKILNARQSISG